MSGTDYLELHFKVVYTRHVLCRFHVDKLSSAHVYLRLPKVWCSTVGVRACVCMYVCVYVCV